MSPERTFKTKRHIVEEFYWAGYFVIYVDNKRSDDSWEEAIGKVMADEGIQDIREAIGGKG